MSDSFDSEDKSVVEFQLGNKQLFLLFIGLLVIGAIIFFIGLRVGADSAKGKVALNLGAEENPTEVAQGDTLDEQTLDIRPTIKPSTEEKKGASGRKGVQLDMNEKAKEVVSRKDLPKTEKPKSKKSESKKQTETKKQPEVKKQTPPKTTSKASGIYYVQIAAPQNKARAGKMLTKLPRSIKGEIQKKSVKGKIYYRVLVGPYPSKAKAEAARQALLASYKGAFIQIKK